MKKIREIVRELAKVVEELNKLMTGVISLVGWVLILMNILT